MIWVLCSIVVMATDTVWSNRINSKQVLLEGANSLASRFNPVVGCIRSWDHNGDKWQYPVIIDNMMNLEFSVWANQSIG